MRTRSPSLALVALAALFPGGPSLGGDAPTPNGGPSEPVWTKEQREHWSYLPPKRPATPAVKDPAWVRNPIDAFVLKELEANDLAPAPEADKATLIRRLRFDLTGLPPTPEEIDAFLADDRPDAYERLVDRLLRSEEYGERWAQMWLDLARYAESDGFKSDKTRPSAYRYRDWVIKALNADVPYDRFVKLQLAGDEYAPGDAEAFLATGFNRNYPFEDNNMVPGLNRQLMLDDVTDTTASVFLGLTVGCARCHNHKFDAISQRDYYRFQALFGATKPKDDQTLATPAERAFHDSVEAEHAARFAGLKAKLDRVEQPYAAKILKAKIAKMPKDVQTALATDPVERSASQEDLLKRYAKDLVILPATMTSAMSPVDKKLWTGLDGKMKELTKALPPGPGFASGMADSGANAEPVMLRHKGNFANPGDEIAPGFLSLFSGTLPTFDPKAAATATSSGRRKALAEWITRADNPLSARVMVNRLWQHHFGRGIVTTPSDFGTQGTEPTHPALLDWLATEFVGEGWGMKSMHRLMVTSATYRQSSTPPEKSLDADPDDTLFGRMFRRRLEGEAVRDALLVVSGKLDARFGGPSVYPDLPPGVETRGGWERSKEESDRNRRSVYVFVRRNLKYPLFDAFDSPDTNTTCAERNVSVNAPQALMLLNSDLVLGQAQALAGRLLKEVRDRNDPKSLVAASYRLALGRAPKADELERGVRFLDEQPAVVSGGDAALDLPTPTPDGYLPARGAALVDFCHVLLNLNEFVFVD